MRSSLSNICISRTPKNHRRLTKNIGRVTRAKWPKVRLVMSEIWLIDKKTEAAYARTFLRDHRLVKPFH